MLVVCYHNGALGHTLTALLDCCTEEGNLGFPSFVKGKHLHNHKPQSTFYCVRHPMVDMDHERKIGNTIISSTSMTTHGRLLILLMGMIKNYKCCPEFNSPVFYNQGNGTFGEQIEVLSYTLQTKVNHGQWFHDTDVVLDILNFWIDPDAVIKFIHDCGLTPNNLKVLEFCKLVTETNQEYFDTMQKCIKITNDVVDQQSYDINLNFFETAMCHSMLLEKTSKHYQDLLLLKSAPQSTDNFIEIFKD
jgi:hypothetical protein